MLTVKKHDRIKILYIILFVVLLLELGGAFIGFFSDSAAVRNASYSNTFLIVLTTIALVIPWIVEVKFKVDIPDVLEFVVLAMIFVAIILGFLNDYYVDVKGFDKFTHALSGVTISLLAFQTIVFLNRYEKIPLLMGPGITGIFSFALSMTLLVVWEFYEFSVDTIRFLNDTETTSNMQRYQWTNESTFFPQDYGLYDTMIDLWVGAFGALIVAIVGYYIIRNNPIYKKTIKK